MSQFKALLKASLVSGLNNLKASMSKKSKKDNIGIGPIVGLVIVFAVVFGGMIFLPLGAATGIAALVGGIEASFFTIALGGVSLLMVMFAISYILNIMYFSRDNEFLLSLPLKNSTIFLVKLTVIYIYLLILSLFFVVFFCIPYGITAALSWTFYLCLPLVFIVLPILPLFIGTMLSFPFMYIVSYIKKNRILSTVFVILAIVLFAGVYIIMFAFGFNSGSSAGGTEEELIQMSQASIAMIKQIASYIVFFNGFSDIFISHINIPLSLVYIIGCNGAFVFLSILLCKALYRRGMSKQLESSSEIVKVVKGKEYATNTPTAALVKKELKMFVRNPMMLMYALMEVVLPIVMIVIMSSAFSGIQSDLVAGVLPSEIYNVIGTCMILFFGLSFACGMNYMAVSSVSREGRALAMVKTMPVSILKQLEVKGLIAYCLPIISLLSITIVSAIMGIVSVLSAIFFFVFTAILAYGFTFLQVGMDVKKPKLDWENITQVMQNNVNVFKCMGISILITLVVVLLMSCRLFLIGFFPAIVLEVLAWSVLIIGSVIFSILVRKKYLRNVIFNFENIEA